MSREQFIQTEIERAFEAADDDWKNSIRSIKCLFTGTDNE